MQLPLLTFLKVFFSFYCTETTKTKIMIEEEVS